MNEAACFHVIGEMPEDKTISLAAGVNYIPVLCDQPVVATDIFSQLGDNLKFAYDLLTEKVYWPEGGLYTLEYLQPGVGYAVHMLQAGEATYTCAEQLKMSYAAAQPRVYENAPWNYQQSGVQHFISINKSAFAELEKGDFIGVFNAQNECAGLVQYNGEEGNLFLVVNGDDITTDALDGFTEGENMSFRIYSPSQMSETEVAVEFAASMPNTGSFADNGRSMILKIGAEATAIQENIQSNISIYPNPATEMVNIHLNGDYSEATVVVYNPEGRAVINQVFNGQTEMNVSSLEPGFYFVRISTSTINEVRKLVIR